MSTTGAQSPSASVPLVLHQYEISPFCDKVRRALHVKDLEFEIREVPAMRANIAPRRVNPVGKLPVLETGSRRIADSSAIVRWLDERHPDPPLIPADPGQAALCHVLEDWADESLYFYEMTVRIVWRHNARRWLADSLQTDPAWFRPVAGRLLPVMIGRKARSQGIALKAHADVIADVAQHVAAIEGLLGEGDWLVGSQLSIADIAVAAQLRCILMAQETAGLVQPAGPVASWLQRVDELTLTVRHADAAPNGDPTRR